MPLVVCQIGAVGCCGHTFNLLDLGGRLLSKLTLSDSARIEQVKLLLKHGARPDFIAPNGKSAMDVIDLPSKREKAASNEGLKWLKQRGFKIRLVAPTPDQADYEKQGRRLYEKGLIAPY